jgi:Ni,Fe-hydrogenase III small subunit
VTRQQASRVKRAYEQMPEPKAVIAVGNCGNTGDVFFESYNLVGPIDEIVPVDVHVIGCPPRPENILYGVVKAWTKLETLEAKA